MMSDLAHVCSSSEVAGFQGRQITVSRLQAIKIGGTAYKI